MKGREMDPLGRIQAKKIVNRIFISDLVFFLATAIVSLILGSLLSGKKGLWGSIIAVIVLFVFSLFTPLAFKILSRTKDPKKFIIFITGSWFLKLIVVFVALLILSHFTFFNRSVFAWTVFAGALGILGIEGLTVLLTGLPRGEEKKEATDE